MQGGIFLGQQTHFKGVVPYQPGSSEANSYLARPRGAGERKAVGRRLTTLVLANKRDAKIMNQALKYKGTQSPQMRPNRKSLMLRAPGSTASRAESLLLRD